MYLLAKYYKTPRDPKRTSEKGYLDNPENFQWDENVNFVIKPNKRDIRDNNVVLDIFGQQVLKCSISDMQDLGDHNFDAVFAYFYKNYQNYFDRMFAAVGLKAVDGTANEITIGDTDAKAAELVDGHPESPAQQPETV
jgi:hypothetical protein